MKFRKIGVLSAGREATLTEVKKTVADLKIQIDNLCQVCSERTCF